VKGNGGILFLDVPAFFERYGILKLKKLETVGLKVEN
jgi:hypothetical protein